MSQPPDPPAEIREPAQASERSEKQEPRYRTTDVRAAGRDQGYPPSQPSPSLSPLRTLVTWMQSVQSSKATSGGVSLDLVIIDPSVVRTWADVITKTLDALEQAQLANKLQDTGVK